MRLPDSATAREIVSVIERFVLEPVFLESLVGRLAIVVSRSAISGAIFELGYQIALKLDPGPRIVDGTPKLSLWRIINRSGLPRPTTSRCFSAAFIGSGDRRHFGRRALLDFYIRQRINESESSFRLGACAR